MGRRRPFAGYVGCRHRHFDDGPERRSILTVEYVRVPLLGYDRDVPALGFAYNLDAIVESRSRELDPSPDLTVVSPVETGSVDSAIQQARQLRASGKRAAIDFESPSSQGEGQGER